MLKKYLLSLILLFGGVSLSLNAQSDGFFRSGYDNDYTNRDNNITYDITLGGVTNDENPTVPVGSGLLIMVAAGAGYVVARRKGAARKGMTMILALGLVLGMTQCKKNTVQPVTPAGNSVHITLNANFGGEKTGFNPTTGQFVWSSGITEYINVGGDKSGYIGQLQSTWTAGFESVIFSGDITPAADEETLYFFYLGNGNHAGASTVDFSSQDGTLANVTNCHIAIGSEEYTGQTEFSATLNMAMAIAYFDLSGFGNETVSLFGNDVYSAASIDYKNGSITGTTKGNINVGTANNGIYVALIPSVSTETVLQFDSNSKTGIMRFLRGIKPASYYSNSGEALSVTANELFSVSSTKKVRFSRGNLQYIGSAATPYWRFATNQYDYLATTTGQNSASENVDRDLFGWGTSGENTKMPYMTSVTNTDYGNGENDIFNTNYDWGKMNSSSIENGGGFDGWYTLQRSEWTWLLGPQSNPTPGTNCRNVINSLSTGARFILATIADEYKGMIVFPDNYTHPSDVTIGGTITPNAKSDYTALIASVDDWKKMEIAGAVFLPAAGYRSQNYGISSMTNYTNGGSHGYYWSSSYKNSTDSYSINFNSSSYGNPSGQYRKLGYSVRLVRE